MDVKVQLKRRADLHGNSMEEEVRQILRDALKEEATAAGGLGTEIAALFERIGLDDEISELRGYDIQPAEFAG
jgi:plasmid stability protein